MIPRARRVAGVLAVVVVALLAADALARPGGGQSFSGRSSSSSSSSGAGGSRSWGGSSSSTSSSGGSRSWGGSTSTSSSGGSRSWGGSTTSSSSSGGSYSWGSTTSTSSGGSSYSPGTTAPSEPYAPSSSPYHPDGSTPPPSRAFLYIFLGFVVVALAVWGYGRYLRKRQEEWIARADAEAQAEEDRWRRWASIDEALAILRAQDDAFSFVLFEDFLYALYGETHAARGKPAALEALAAYLSERARANVSLLGDAPVTAIVIGGMRVEQVRTRYQEAQVYVTVTFTTNVSQKAKDGREQAYFHEERWSLVRDANAKSRPPERARTIDCPSCGAPRDKTVGGKCGYCGAGPTEGGSDWYVVDIELLHREARGPMLTGTTEEVGTDLPTVVAPDVKKQLEDLQREDPSFTWAAFVARVGQTFAMFHTSWTAQDLSAVRPFLSDNLYELQRYWVQAYQAQGLRNITENPTIVTIHLARVTRDRYFHAITVRVFATCTDYTVDAGGKVVGGKQNAVRAYSEYWTFVRGVGAKGAPRADLACPSCGAALAGVNMAGKCGSCGAKVTSGEFDWVLSRIEQDEVYETAA